jgi:hypothetical protein
MAAVAGAAWALPASAGNGVNAIPSKPEVTLAQLDLCLGPGCLDRDRICERGYYVRYDDDWRRHGDNGATIEAEPVVTWRFANGAATRS